MSQLPRGLPWGQANAQWPATLNPVIANPLVNGQQINLIVLTANTPRDVSHSLGQLPKGWIVVNQDAAASVFKSQPFNAKTITLEANANVTVSIWIY